MSSNSSERLGKSSGLPRVLAKSFQKMRSKLVRSKSVRYKTSLKFLESDQYSGTVEATFQLGSLGRKGELLMDYSGHTIRRLSINGSLVQLIERQHGRFLRLDNDLLIDNGVNVVSIDFANSFNQVGFDACIGLLQYEDIEIRRELHEDEEDSQSSIENNNSFNAERQANGMKYDDPLDSSAYIYSVCGAGASSSVFPCFDQQDIKARLELSVTIPSDWTFIANELQKNARDASSQLKTKRVEFNPTAFISPNAFAFAAGRYHVIKQNSEQQDLPTSLACRYTLTVPLERSAQMIFEVLNKGVTFFERYSQFKFPFSKLDVLFAPKLDVLSSSNAGVIMLDESLLHADLLYLPSEKCKLFVELLSCIAGQWLGCLVTSKKQSGDWVLDSFRVFLGHSCLFQIETASFSKTDFKTLTKLALAMPKQNMYTEPPPSVFAFALSEKLANGLEAEGTLRKDRTKGAAVFNQIEFVIGPKLLREIARNLVQKHQFENANAKDFFKVVEQVHRSAKKLEFEAVFASTAWLNNASTNLCTPVFDPQFSKSLTIRQTMSAAESPTVLRRHKMKICFFEEDGTAHESTVFVLPQPNSVIHFQYPFPVKAVLLNSDDQALTRVAMDKHSMEFFRRNSSQIASLLLRNIFHNAVRTMLQMCEISATAFLRVALRCAYEELDKALFARWITSIRIALVDFVPTQQIRVAVLRQAFIDLSQEFTIIIDSQWTAIQTELKLIQPPFQSIITQRQDFTWNDFTRYPQKRSRDFQSKAMETFYARSKCEVSMTSTTYLNAWTTALPAVFRDLPQEYAVLFYEKLFPKDEPVERLLQILSSMLTSLKEDALLNPHSHQLVHLLAKSLTYIIRREKSHKLYFSNASITATPKL